MKLIKITPLLLFFFVGTPFALANSQCLPAGFEVSSQNQMFHCEPRLDRIQRNIFDLCASSLNDLEGQLLVELEEMDSEESRLISYFNLINDTSVGLKKSGVSSDAIDNFINCSSEKILDLANLPSKKRIRATSILSSNRPTTEKLNLLSQLVKF